MRDLIQKIDQLSQQLNESIITEKKKKPKPTSPEKWARAKAKARSKFDVYPSAYANAYASKEYKKMGGGWRMGESEEQLDELKCWPGYTRVKGVPAGKPGSCKKKTNEEELNELDWRKGLAAATMAAGALGAGNANAATWDKDSPEWSKSGLPDHVKTDTQFNKADGDKSFNKQMSSVQGPNQYGEYKVTTVDRSSGQSKVTTYVTKNPPKELMMKEASSPAQQAAIAIAMKKAGKTPKKESAIMKGIQNEGK